jgi:hypothetical protein
MRNIRLRELNDILLRQLNFCLSIEKRITLDHHMRKEREVENVFEKDTNEPDDNEEPADVISDM